MTSAYDQISPSEKRSQSLSNDRPTNSKIGRLCLKIVIFTIFVLYLLVALFTVPLLLDEKPNVLQKYEERADAWQQVLVGVTGAFVTCLAFVGLVRHYRLFLLPFTVFLIVLIMADSTDLFMMYSLQLDAPVGGSQVPTHSLTGSQLSIFYREDDICVLSLLVLFKILVSILLVWILLRTYKNDSVLRTGRSPLRNRTRDNKILEAYRVEKEGKALKVGEYFKF